jgi:segregation and condensation protein A
VTASWTIQTEVFDGPLDLLLYLVKRDGVDIRTVPMAKIADAYLEFLDQMKELNLSVASDYLVMAATLTHLKSLELLPRLPTLIAEEDQEDPRETLAKQLLEYERFKRAATELDQHILQGRDVFVRNPEPVASADRPVYSPIDAFGLLDLFYDLLAKQNEEPEDQHVIPDSGTDVITCCREVLLQLGGIGGQMDLRDIMALLTRADHRVVTFIGVLEMARLQWVTVHQTEHLGRVSVIALVAPDADLSQVSGEVAQEAAG